MVNRQTAVGAFVIGGFILGAAALMTFGHFRFFSQSIRAAVVFQGSISGLAVGAPVTFRGVRVGAVESIAITFDQEDQAAYIPVVIDLDPDQVTVVESQHENNSTLDLKRLIAHGLRAQLNMQSFVTGQSNVNLDFDPASPAPLHPRLTSLTEIPVKPSAIQKMKDVLADLPLKELAGSASAVMDNIRILSQRLDDDLPPLLASIRTSSEHSQKTLDVVAETMVDLQKNLSSTIANLNTLLVNGNRQLDARSADAHVALLNIARTAQRATSTLDTLRSMTAAGSESRVNLDDALRDIAAAAAALRGFASDVERNPQLLLTGRKQ
ncbi:Paraquat-inducible protein B [Granulibacter bethesdensis]|uniref:MlaD family protein n=1 Tax=Granulibacter bethesdensis TaxID=364410 RepID=UPI000909C8B0|nr:MlaD family protein [Granulibacter bethesdensis]APH57284.1 Paraquat-inducible protein B [Granulibacter bethesdensis]